MTLKKQVVSIFLFLLPLATDLVSATNRPGSSFSANVISGVETAAPLQFTPEDIALCCTGNAVQGGAFDQREMETRNDILVYTSEPLKEGLEVTGFIESTIYVSSDAKDTDFTIKLIDVYPDGTAYNLDETITKE